MLTNPICSLTLNFTILNTVENEDDFTNLNTGKYEDDFKINDMSLISPMNINTVDMKTTLRLMI